MQFKNCKKQNHYSYTVSISLLRKVFDVPSLEFRRDMSNMLFYYKILNNLIDCTEILNIIQFSVKGRTLRGDNLFATPFCHANFLSNFSLFRFYRSYNEFSKSLDIFNMPFGVFRNVCKGFLCVPPL